MWGRSLYLNIRRFIIFQMTINVCACLIVLLGSFIGLDSPLTVTQMLWVNLIMDTFAAMALSSLPADKGVLNEKPRNPESHIISKPMLKRIAGTGIMFFIILGGIWQLLAHTNANSVMELFNFQFVESSKAYLSAYDHGLFFSIFVMLQFWNIFNAKYFKTNRSLIQDIIDLLSGNKQAVKETYSMGFIWIASLIIIGQIIIVTFGGQMFTVAPLSPSDWGLILLLTSPVLIVADVFRYIKNRQTA
jgi:Ca2+-transporting ATPase